MSFIKYLSTMVLLLCMVVGYQNCEESDGITRNGTETGDPSLTLHLSGFEQTSMLDYLLPKAFAQVYGGSLCIHQIRFKADNSSTDPGENSNIPMGIVELNPSGTDLGEISVSPGDYRRIDIMVKNDCESGVSIEIENDNGTFDATAPKTLRFIGEITIDENTEAIILNFVPFANFFDSVNSAGDLNGGVETIEGGF